jgi:hypothetical protein
MKKFIIRDLDTLQEYIGRISNPVIGVGARPYNPTIGVYNLFKYFEILACRRSTKDAELLEKKIKITYLEKNGEFRNVENYATYQTHKPKDIFNDKKILRYLDSFPEPPILLLFKMTPETTALIRKRSYFVVGTDFKMNEKYENKINFQNLLNSLSIASPKNIVLGAMDITYEKISSLIGSDFVIQLPSTALGAGTFFVHSEKDFQETLQKDALVEARNKNIDLKISQFIESSTSPSMTVCVTKFGVLHTNLQKQIIDEPAVLEAGRRSGVFCGHDWTNSIFNQHIENQASFTAKKIGSYFKEHENFQGIFGIDFVLEKYSEKLYPIEANVRLLGSFPILSMIQKSANQPLIQAIQIIESLNRDDYILDIESLNSLMQKPKIGAHLNLYSRDKNLVYVSGDIQPGIYKADKKSKKITFLREGIFFEDLKSPEEILLANGVPFTGRVFEQHSSLCKLVSQGSFLKDDGALTDLAKTMVKYTYNKLALKNLPQKNI